MNDEVETIIPIDDNDIADKTLSPCITILVDEQVINLSKLVVKNAKDKTRQKKE